MAEEEFNKDGFEQEAEQDAQQEEQQADELQEEPMAQPETEGETREEEQGIGEEAQPETEEETREEERREDTTYEVEEVGALGSDIIELGGNITLKGFENIDGGSMIILKKIIGGYARKFSDNLTNFERLNMTLRSSEEVYVILAEVVNDGKSTNSEVSDRNMFFGISKALEELNHSLIK